MNKSYFAQQYACLLNRLIGLVRRMFANNPGDQGSIPRHVIHLKWYLIPPCLTLRDIRYVSRVKWSNPGKGVVPSLHLGVVAIEKGTFLSLSTKVANNNNL